MNAVMKPWNWKRPPQIRLALEEELIVDNFAGGGGASMGIEQGAGRPVDIAINHDQEAIAQHEANHPHTRHYCEDVYAVDPVKVCAGRSVGIAWFSPDCKHFSKAKGGKPVSKKIRGLAGVAVRWARRVRPRIIVLENVEEFQDWGPLLPNNKPCPVRKGTDFRRFVRGLQRCGYEVEWRELRACDYGAPTIRKRLFLIARCDGMPIVWPEATHGPGLEPYNTAADCIDWSLPCHSIFLTKEEGSAVGVNRPLAEATMRRIAKGVKRYVLDGPEPFIVTCNHGGDWFRGQAIDKPFNTVTAARDAHGLVMPFLTEHANASTQRTFRILEPLRTQCAETKGGHFAVVAPTLIQTGYGERPGQDPRVPGLGKPLGTVVAGGVKHALVAAFLAQHNTGVVGHRAEKPLSTITGRGTQQQIVASHLVKLRNNCDGQSMYKPVHTITTGGHFGEVRAFLVKYYGCDQDPRLREPLHTVTTKHRFGLVTVHGEDYVIADIGMRMLQPRELYRAQGFPDDYIIDPIVNGKPLTKTAQVRMCGNSVPPPFARAIVEANLSVDAFAAGSVG